MHPADLEALVRNAISELPQPRAPHSLLPRVLATVNAWSRQPWYARAWFTWPRGGQVAAVAAVSTMAASAFVVLLTMHAAVARVTAVPGRRIARAIDAAGEYLAIATDVGQVLWGTLGEPLAGYASAVVIVMCFACAVFGAALNHVVLGRMSER